MATDTAWLINISKAYAGVHLMDSEHKPHAEIKIGSGQLWERQEPFRYVLKKVQFRGTRCGVYISDKTTKWEIHDNCKMFIVGRDDYWYACEGVIEDGQVVEARIDRACFRIRKDEFALESEGWFEWTLSNRTDDDTQVEAIPWHDSHWWVSTMHAETRILRTQEGSAPVGGA